MLVADGKYVNVPYISTVYKFMHVVIRILIRLLPGSLRSSLVHPIRHRRVIEAQICQGPAVIHAALLQELDELFDVVSVRLGAQLALPQQAAHLEPEPLWT